MTVDLDAAGDRLAAARASFERMAIARFALGCDVGTGAGGDPNNRCDVMVAEWTSQGVVRDVLMPLLTAESLIVRLAAALYLCHRGAADVAAPVLRELGRHKTDHVRHAAEVGLAALRPEISHARQRDEVR